MSVLAGPMFPCPICGSGLEVRASKKAKPYVVCEPCGVQLFVRQQTGIRKFQELVKRGERKDIWETLEHLKDHYRKKCPECEEPFWIHEAKIDTNWFDGSFEGYKCPNSKCKGILKVEKKK